MKNIAILSTLILLTSCAVDIDYYMPVNRFDTPETSGKLLSGKLEFQTSHGHHVQLGEVWDDIVFGSGTTTNSDVAMDKGFSMGLAFDLGLHEKVDFFYRTSYDATKIFGLKVQLIGASQIEQKEGFKLSVSAGAGKSTSDEGDVTVDDGVSQSKRLTANLESKAIDFSVIGGYRFQRWLLTYLNGYYTKTWVDGSIQEDGQEALSARGLSHNYGLLLGARLGNRMYLTPEIGVSRGTYEEHSQTINTFALATGYTW